MSEPDLDALIVGNLADLDSAVRHIEETLQPALAEEMDKLIEAFRCEIGWDGKTDWKDDGEVWLAPSEWRASTDSDGEEFKCFFVLDFVHGPGQVEDFFWITSLVHAGVASLGFRWLRDGVTKRAWRKAVSQEPDLVSTIRACGFNYDESDGSFILPFFIPHEALAEALREESSERAFGPLRQALQRLPDAKPAFDALVGATVTIEQVS
jgi:hypothetical protein